MAHCLVSSSPSSLRFCSFLSPHSSLSPRSLHLSLPFYPLPFSKLSSSNRSNLKPSQAKPGHSGKFWTPEGSYRQGIWSIRDDLEVPSSPYFTAYANNGQAQGPPPMVKTADADNISEYKPGLLDDLFLAMFRNKMVKEVGWDSDKPGYDGLIEVVNRLMLTGRSNADTRDAAVRILRSLFPPLLLDVYKLLISPLGGGKVAAIMVARVTAMTCQWLMGTCAVNSVDLPDGSSCQSGVFVERCKYLEESKCVGICVNTCKFPTQTFFKDYMGVPLLMEPNFTDYSCKFKFGVLPPQPEDDGALKEPCLEACPIASRRRQTPQNTGQCPKA